MVQSASHHLPPRTGEATQSTPPAQTTVEGRATAGVDALERRDSALRRVQTGPASPRGLAQPGVVTAQSSRSPAPGLEAILLSGNLERVVEYGTSNRQVVIELQTLLFELGYARELNWARFGADGDYGGSTQAALRAYAIERRLVEGPYDGKRVTPAIARALLRDAAARRDRRAGHTHIDTLVREIATQDPALVMDIADGVAEVVAITDPNERYRALLERFDRLDTRLNSLDLSPTARNEWHRLASQASANRNDPRALLHLARTTLAGYATALGQVLSEHPNSDTFGELESIQAAYQQAASRERDRIAGHVELLTPFLAESHPAMLRDVVAAVGELQVDSVDDKITLLERGVARLRDRLRYLPLTGEAAIARDELTAEIDRLRNDRALLPLASQILPVFLEALRGDEGSDIDLNEIEATLSEIVGAGMTANTLRGIVPTLSQADARLYAPLLQRAMEEFEIRTPLQQAAFVAQIAHESGGFRYFYELGGRSYFKRYEGRKDLGNTEDGDGYRFRGRGVIQITGRVNYAKVGAALYGDESMLLDAPSRAAEPWEAFRIAAWFWRHGTRTDLNNAAEARDFRLVTRRINGGYNGLADRIHYYNRALDALGIG